MLFHFSSCAPRRGETIAAAVTARSNATKRLDIARTPSDSLKRRRPLYELLAVDHHLSPDLSDRLAVLRRSDVQAHHVPGLEGVLGPASAGLGDGIPCFEDPVLNGAAVILGIHFHEDMRIRPHVLRDHSAHRN